MHTYTEDQILAMDRNQIIDLFLDPPMILGYVFPPTKTALYVPDGLDGHDIGGQLLRYTHTTDMVKAAMHHKDGIVTFIDAPKSLRIHYLFAEYNDPGPYAVVVKDHEDYVSQDQ